MSEHKTYITKTRTAILNYLKSNCNTMISAKDIINYLHNNGISANQTTVYRYLEDLCKKQIILKFPDNTGEKFVYQYVDNDMDCNNHLHLKCTECGKLIHLDCPFFHELNNHIQNDHNFFIKCEGNVLYGICKDCSIKNK